MMEATARSVQTDPFERISASVTGTLRLFNFVFDRTRDLETKIV
jgi:hypothetical protein